MRRMWLIAVTFLSLCSCQVMQPRQARELYVESGYSEIVANAKLVLDSIMVQRGFDSGAIRENAAYILQLLLVQRNQDLADPSKTLLVHALIKEEEFAREFKTLHTVTVELSLFDPPKSGAVVLSLYSENTRDTIQSYAYLHSLIRRALRNLTR